MTKGAPGEKADTALSLARARLWRGKWSIASAALALVGLSVFAQGPLLAALAGIALVAAATALLPDGGGAGAAGAADSGADRFTAADLVGAVSDPVIVVDRETFVVEANSAARAAFERLSPGAPLSLRLRSPEMQALFSRLSEADFAGGEAIWLERVPIERLFRVLASPLGQSQLRVLVFRDQSEMRRIDRMRADFVANASHELRTPLASISGFIETLRGSARNDPAARESFLQIMQAQTERMARLIDDLLSLSRLEMQPLVDRSALVDLVSVAEEAIESMVPLVQESGMTIQRSFAVTEAPVAGSRDELLQLFQNLLENACKYGRSGGSAAVSIEAAGAGSSREFRATVEDFGQGVAEEHIPRLTERFYRVETGNPQKGTGLGLSIVKHILTRHDGYLSIRSDLGRGAAFTIHLPAAAEPGRERARASPQDRRRAAQSGGVSR